MAIRRQFPQRQRRDRQRQHRSPSAQSTNREFAQRARRNREYLFRQQLSINTQLPQSPRQNRESPFQQKHLPIARTSLSTQSTDTVSFRHRLGRCNVLCIFYGAEHWIEERVQGSSKVAPKFSTCCQGGAVIMDKFNDPPQPLYSLLMDSTPGMFPCLIFFDDQPPHNFAKILEITIMRSLSVPSVSR